MTFKLKNRQHVSDLVHRQHFGRRVWLVITSKWLTMQIWRRHRVYTATYCPMCEHELTGSTGLLTSYIETLPSGLARYNCTNCGCTSDWDFDIAPAPILARYQRFTKRLYRAER